MKVFSVLETFLFKLYLEVKYFQNGFVTFQVPTKLFKVSKTFPTCDFHDFNFFEMFFFSVQKKRRKKPREKNNRPQETSH